MTGTWYSWSELRIVYTCIHCAVCQLYDSWIWIDTWMYSVYSGACKLYWRDQWHARLKNPPAKSFGASELPQSSTDAVVVELTSRGAIVQCVDMTMYSIFLYFPYIHNYTYTITIFGVCMQLGRHVQTRKILGQTTLKPFGLSGSAVKQRKPAHDAIGRANGPIGVSRSRQPSRG